jgi:hypothetical protein
MVSKLKRLERLMKWLKMAIGAGVAVIGALMMWYFLDDVLGMFKGIIGLTVLIIGLMIFTLAWYD